MPRVDWGITSGEIDEFDRDSQFKPYTGPQPPANAVFCFTLKTLKYAAPTEEGKWPQMRAGLSLEPRNQDEARYAGFFIMHFMTISPKRADSKGTGFQYIPFLDALGVSATDFTKRTNTDEDGNIKRIGNWRNQGDTLVLARLAQGANFKTGAPQLQVDWIGDASEVEFEEYDPVAPEDEFEDDLDDEEFEDDE